MIIRKAVTFRASSLGDALMAKHLLENIHAAYPDARLGLVVAGRGAMVRDLLAAYPWIEVMEANRRSIRSLARLFARFHGSDLVVTPPVKPDGRFSLGSKIAARLLARPGGLFGFTDASSMNGFFYTGLVPSDITKAPRLLEEEALGAAGIPVSIPAMTLEHLPQPELLPRLGLAPKRYIVVHLFAGAGNRAMSQASRQKLLEALARELPDVPLVLTGTGADLPYIQELPLPASARVVAGELSVQELAALIAQSACMVSIGTGPSHMASHLGAPLLVLVVCFGIPWCGEEQFGDRAARIFSDTQACAGGHDFSNHYAACIEGIDMEAVAKAARPYVSA